jgi:hypothetical protein
VQDVAGVYETVEIKEQIENTRSWHLSTKWILDLSESGGFTLTSMVFRVPTQDKKYSPIPEKSLRLEGAYTIKDNSVVLRWTPFVPIPVGGEKDDHPDYIMPLSIQSNEDLVAGEFELSFPTDIFDRIADGYLAFSDVETLRFTRKQ